MRYIGYFILAVLIIGCQEQQKKAPEEVISPVEKVETPYSDWHTGKFYYKEDKIGTFLVNRTDSIQEEFIKSTGMIVEFDINWTTDSTYTLKFVKISDNPHNKEVAEGVEQMIKECTITDVRRHSYTERATSNLSDKEIYTKIYRN